MKMYAGLFVHSGNVGVLGRKKNVYAQNKLPY